MNSPTVGHELSSPPRMKMAMLAARPPHAEGRKILERVMHFGFLMLH